MEYKIFHSYLVYENGDIYSLYTNKILSPDKTKFGYYQVTLFINGKAQRYKVHRLVAMLYIENPDNLPVVHHIDGNKSNNHFTNLQWTTYEQNNRHARESGLNDISKSNSERWKNEDFRKRVSKNISEGRIRNKSSEGERNGRFRYRIYKNDELISRKELKEYLCLSQSYVDALIKRAANGESIPVFIKNNIKIIDIKNGQQTI